MTGRYGAAVEEVRNSVSALMAAEALGLEPDRHGRCRCPFHNGNDRNLKLYGDDRGYYCFVCHTHGDVFSLVQGATGEGFTNALRWLCETFGIRMGNDTAFDAEAAQRAAQAQERRKAEREHRKEMQRVAYDMYLSAGDLLREMEKQRDEHAPKTPDEKWDPKFAEAVEAIPEILGMAEEMALDVFGGGKR